MEYEFHEPPRRGRYIVILGILLAVIAGGAAFGIITQVQQQAGQAQLQRVPVVVAAVDIPARKVIESADVVLRQVPIDDTNAKGVFTDASKVVGLIPGVTILKGQPVYANLLAGADQSGPFAILGPTETVGPDSEAWRAVSITVPDDRAVGGLLVVGQEVDIFVSATVNVPDALVAQGKYYTDKSTKIVYQDVTILARAASYYVVRVSLAVAEEINHLQASGTASFSLALRPSRDLRQVDASGLGATTNRIITKYGLPIPETYPAGGPVSTLGPVGSPTPAPSSAAPSPAAP